MNKVVNILLVEDDEVDVMAMQRAFKQCDIANKLTIASNGIEALKILRGSQETDPMAPPFMIILDLNMPCMNGFEFLEELRKDAKLKKSIVFVLSTSENDQDITQAYEKFIAGYIKKSDFNDAFFDATTMLKLFSETVEFPK